jgi:HEAT repeat protein
MKKLTARALIFVAVFSLYAQENAENVETAGQAPVDSAVAVPAARDSAPSVEEQRIAIIRFGTDTEIANLVKILRSEQPASSGEDKQPAPPEDSVTKELAVLAGNSKNKNILSSLFSFFGDNKLQGLEDSALKILEDRDNESFETVQAAIDYLGRLESAPAAGALENVLDGEETRYLNASIRAMGKIAKSGDSERTADYLIDYYNNKNPGVENRREIIIAVGASAAKNGAPFLVSIVENNDESAPLRMAALSGLANIADESGLPAIIAALSSGDPNVRSAAVAALGPFQGAAVDSAILEAFRDSYYRTRIAAAQASRERKFEAALPYLKFRCENDDVPAVRDEAVKALGAIGTPEAARILAALFAEKKHTDRLRVAAAEMLLENDAASHAPDIIAALDPKNKTLYNGLLRALGGTKTASGAGPESLKELARRFFASGGVIEKSYALDICRNNNFRGLAADIRNLSDPKNGSLSAKARRILEEWGENVE